MNTPSLPLPMPTVLCDRCDKPFDTGNAAPGTKIACPACGDVKIVPDGAGARAGAPAVVAVAVEG
jgi:hypothetical protein